MKATQYLVRFVGILALLTAGYIIGRIDRPNEMHTVAQADLERSASQPDTRLPHGNKYSPRIRAENELAGDHQEGPLALATLQPAEEISENPPHGPQLTFEQTNDIRLQAYDFAQNTSFAEIGYLDRIECGLQSCQIELQILQQKATGRKSSDIISGLNERLQQSPHTEGLQVYLRSFAADESGGAYVKLIAAPTQEPAYRNNVVYESLASGDN